MISSMKNGVPSVRSTDEPLDQDQIFALTYQRREHLFGALPAERVET